MKVLVAYGSKRGGTEGIAGMIQETLVSLGDEVTFCRPGESKPSRAATSL
jgi:flavodoxin